MQPSNSKHGSNLVNNPDVLEWTSEWVVYPHKRISLNNKKKKQLLIHAWIRMDIKEIKLKKYNIKYHYGMIPFIWNSRKSKIIVTESRSVFAKSQSGSKVW